MYSHLTGQQEVNTLVKKLRKTFPLLPRESNSFKAEEIEKEKEDNEESEVKNSDDEEPSGNALRRKLKKIRQNALPDINLEE